MSQITATFDELHVISDLHLGGPEDFQIFGSTAELAALVTELANADSTRRIGLLINGDFIDFLAEKPNTYFDPKGAIAKLDRIMGDLAFAPVFRALQKFLVKKNRTLIVNLGNHDLELALPWVREHLIQALCGRSLVARGKMRIVLDGTGILCGVGQARVLCVHGNEVDSWNVADFERLRRIGRNLQFGQVVDAWVPNAGTRMVIDVMNDIKKRYPFVDLLKPETEAVVPILLALDPSALQKLREAAAAAGRRAWDAARMATGFLGDVPVAVAETATSPPEVPLSRISALVPGASLAAAEPEHLLELVENEARQGTKPIDLVRGEQAKQLGFWGAAWKLITGKPTHEVLREALENLDKDRSFEIVDEKDETYRELEKLTAPDIDFVVAGHTHLERAMPRKSGRGAYFNSGTWARLIRIEPDVRRDPVRFERLFNLLKGGTMAALDAEGFVALAVEAG
jgi:UDP-2,3-diacylglucosamine pyrophosphatase LpxH